MFNFRRHFLKLNQVPMYNMSLAAEHKTTFTVYKDSLVFRRATQDDKKEILAMPQDIPTDYLPSHFYFMMKAENRECYIAEIDKKIVGFAAIAYVDGGRTCIAHSGRVHGDYEGKGVNRFMLSKLYEKAKTTDCVLFGLVNYISETKFHLQNMHRHNYKPSFFTKIDTRMRENLVAGVNKQVHNIPEVTSKDISIYITNESTRRYLFPCSVIMLGGMVYTTTTENVPLLRGRSTHFYSSFKTSVDTCTNSGLLSAGTFYECPTTPGYSMYVVDLFGSDKDDVQKHINFHLNLALFVISGPFFFEVNVDEGDITGTVCMELSRTGFEIKINTSVFLVRYCKSVGPKL